MNLAVLLYQDDPNKPEGMPDAWPSECLELGTGTELPGPEWVLMTTQEYIDHRAAYQADYDAWWASQIVEE